MTKFGDTVPVKSWQEFGVAMAILLGWMAITLGSVYVYHNYYEKVPVIETQTETTTRSIFDGTIFKGE